jgi:hypothetical protein
MSNLLKPVYSQSTSTDSAIPPSPTVHSLAHLWWMRAYDVAAACTGGTVSLVQQLTREGQCVWCNGQVVVLQLHPFHVNVTCSMQFYVNNYQWQKHFVATTEDHVYKLLHINAALQVLRTTADVTICPRPYHNCLDRCGSSLGLREYPQWLHCWEHKTAPAGYPQADSKISGSKSSSNRYYSC